jgi:hypothetical protein
MHVPLAIWGVAGVDPGVLGNILLCGESKYNVHLVNNGCYSSVFLPLLLNVRKNKP